MNAMKNTNIVLAFAITLGIGLVTRSHAQVCSDYGFFCRNCTTVSVCRSNIPIEATLNCPDGYYCDSTSPNICTNANANCDEEIFYSFYDCATTGRFEWIYNCSEYVWCVDDSTGVISPTLQSCPETTVFNPTTSTCVLPTSSYDCSNIATTSEENEVSTIANSIEDSFESTETDYDSTTNPESTSSSTSQQIFIETTSVISSTEEFSTSTTNANDNISTTSEGSTITDQQTNTFETMIPTTTTTTTTTTNNIIDSTTTPEETTNRTTTNQTTTTTTTTTSPTETTFTCTSYGRFAITQDTSCQTYYFCYPNDDGTFIQWLETCPTTTVFNPTTSQCVVSSSYTCND